MLDRKIKDIDARVELLEDRKKNNIYPAILILILWAFFILVSLYAMNLYMSIDFSETDVTTVIRFSTIVITSIVILASLSISLFIIAQGHSQDYSYYNLLIYLKRNFEKRNKNERGNEETNKLSKGMDKDRSKK